MSARAAIRSATSLPGWTEWNGRYRDAVRRFWRGDRGTLPELATRLAGSSDLYSSSGRQPHASVNFVTAHDGFTLADLVTYTAKHNEANGEDNRDGESNNLSLNCGVEGPSTDPHVMELRRRQRRNLLVTLLVSQGVPMISGGDELGRSQLGNNNAYCHDSALTWTPWAVPDADHRLLEFLERLVAVRTHERRAAPAHVPRRAEGRRRRRALASPRRRRNDRCRLGRCVAPVGAACCSTAPASASSTTRASPSSATVSTCF